MRRGFHGTGTDLDTNFTNSRELVEAHLPAHRLTHLRSFPHHASNPPVMGLHEPGPFKSLWKSPGPGSLFIIRGARGAARPTFGFKPAPQFSTGPRPGTAPGLVEQGAGFFFQPRRARSDARKNQFVKREA